MYEDRNGTDIYYYYDSYGTPVSIRYYEPDGTSYRFYLATNQQGDVIGLYNTSGNMVVRYEYDAWGNIISTTNANGDGLNSLSQKWSDINPFRYRGYYYDSEIGLYYLQSRYYDAEVGRFINSDVLLDNRDLTTINPFVYCGNNPVVYVDENGCSLKSFIDRFKQIATIVEFAAKYENATGKKYNLENDKYSVIVEKSTVVNTETDMLIEGAAMVAVGFMLEAVLIYLGVPSMAATVGVAIFDILSSAGTGVGIYQRYTITKTSYIQRNVVVADYHGYKVTENKSFKYGVKEEYTFSGDMLVESNRTFFDEYLAYTHRNLMN